MGREMEEDVQEKNVLGEGKSQGKVLEARECLVCLRNTKPAHWAGV